MKTENSLYALVIVSSLGFQFALSLILGYLLGSYLDARFASGQIFSMMGLLAGVTVGGLGAVKLIKPLLSEDNSAEGDSDSEDE